MKWLIESIVHPLLQVLPMNAHLERIEVHHPLIHPIHPSLLQNPPRNKAIRGCSWVLTSHQRKKAGFDRIIYLRGLSRCGLVFIKQPRTIIPTILWAILRAANTFLSDHLCCEIKAAESQLPTRRGHPAIPTPTARWGLSLEGCSTSPFRHIGRVECL